MKFLFLSSSLILALAFLATPVVAEDMEVAANDTDQVEHNLLQLTEVNFMGETCNEMSSDEKEFFKEMLVTAYNVAHASAYNEDEEVFFTSASITSMDDVEKSVEEDLQIEKEVEEEIEKEMEDEDEDESNEDDDESYEDEDEDYEDDDESYEDDDESYENNDRQLEAGRGRSLYNRWTAIRCREGAWKKLAYCKIWERERTKPQNRFDPHLEHRPNYYYMAHRACPNCGVFETREQKYKRLRAQVRARVARRKKAEAAQRRRWQSGRNLRKDKKDKKEKKEKKEKKHKKKKAVDMVVPGDTAQKHTRFENLLGDLLRSSPFTCWREMKYVEVLFAPVQTYM